MQAHVEQSTTAAKAGTISEGEFQRLCDELYKDRLEIYSFRPDTNRSEAILWMLLGCLISLLSVTDAELQALAGESTLNPYTDAICKLLQARAASPFDARPCIEELLKRVETE
jgi:hypothetical protein